MAIPQTIRAGDFIQWNIPASQDYYGNSISSPDWSVVYYLRTNTGPVGATVNSSAYNDGFKFTIASNVTATFTSGNWYYQAVANKSGAEKQVLKYKNGYQERVWVKKSNARNEALDEMVYAWAAYQRLLQKYDRRTIYDQFERKINPNMPLKETKVDLNQTKSAKKSNFVANW